MPIEAKAVVATLNRTTGLQDITIPGFGTPQAAFMYQCWLWPGNEIETTTVTAGFGLTDGVSQCNHTKDFGDNSSSQSQVRLGGFSSAVAYWRSFAFDSFIANGIRINITQADSTRDLYAIFVLIKGVQNVKLGEISSDSGQSTVVINDVGFEPDLIIAMHAGRSSNESSGSDARSSIGFVHKNSSDTIRQVCYAVDSPAALSETLDGYALAWSWNNGAHPLVNFNTFTASGFSATFSGDSPFGRKMNYLAMKLDDPDEVFVDIIDTPITAGITPTYDTGFQPASLLFLPSSHALVDNLYSGVAIENFAHGFGYSDASQDASFVWCQQSSNSGEATRYAGSSVLSTTTDINTILNEAVLSSFESNGFRLNFSTANGTVRKWPILAFKDPSAVAVPKRNPLFFGQDF